MVKFDKNEEYCIIQDDEQFNVFSITYKTPIKCIIEKRKDYYKQMKKCKFEFKHQVVKDLYELGEISRVDAVDLDFCIGLNKNERMLYLNHSLNNYMNTVKDYECVCSSLIQTLVESQILLTFIKSNMDQAEVVNIGKQEIGRLAPEQIKFLCDLKADIWARRKNMLFEEMDNQLSNIEVLYEVLTLEDAFNLKNEIARDMMTQAKRIKYYMITTASEDSLIYLKTLKLLKATMPKEYISFAKTFRKEAKDLKKSYAKTQKVVLYDSPQK